MSRVVEMKTDGWPDVHGRSLNVVYLLGHGYVGPLASCTYRHLVFAALASL